jgi:hypothetical protein
MTGCRVIWWKEPSEVTNEWERVKAMRETPYSLAEGAHANKEPTYPHGHSRGAFNKGAVG